MRRIKFWEYEKVDGEWVKGPIQEGFYHCCSYDNDGTFSDVLIELDDGSLKSVYLSRCQFVVPLKKDDS